jgi:hypothetical protein
LGYRKVFGNVTTLCRIAHKYLLKKTDSVSNFLGIVALSRALAGTVTMQLDLDLIFPIRDVPSAELMTLKAVCLWNAGVIDARQRKLVEQRAQQFLETNIPQDASAACMRSHDSWGRPLSTLPVGILSRLFRNVHHHRF